MRLYSLTIDPHAPSTLYAGTGSHGVWKSVDGAKTWTATGAEVAERRVDAIAIDPANADTVYAGTDRGVAKSVDGGKSWQVATTAPMKDRRVRSLAIDRARPERDLGRPAEPADAQRRRRPHVARDDVRRSNGCRSPRWCSIRSIRTGSPRERRATACSRRATAAARWSAPAATFLATDVTSIAVDPAAPQELWVGTRPTGVYRSQDGGATWSLASEGLTDRVVNV